MNLTLNAVKNSAFLANESYKTFDLSKKDAKPINNDATKSSFEVVAQVNDEATGFSGTVFKDPVSGEYTIAFSGTKIGNGKNKCLNSRI